MKASLGLILIGCEGADDSSEPAAFSTRELNEPGDGEDCHPSYPSVCIPSPPPDLDCADVAHSNFAVEGSDPHRFDGDNDGIGCE